jgi:adenosine deaminase CECR1
MYAEQTDIETTFEAELGDTNKLEAYTKAHSKLLDEEKDDAWDRHAKPRKASRSTDIDTERRAAQIIHAIREYERRVTFGNLASEAIPEPDTRDMGGQFLTNKQRIDTESKLYEIAKMVPKAALLHLHFNAELYPQRLLEQARQMDTMYIRSIRPLLDVHDLQVTETVFTILDPELVEPNVNIFMEDYPGTATNWKQDDMKWKVWMPWKQFQKEFEQRFPGAYVQDEDTSEAQSPTCCADEPMQGNLNPAENWLKSKMVLSQDEAYSATQTVNG